MKSSLESLGVPCRSMTAVPLAGADVTRRMSGLASAKGVQNQERLVRGTLVAFLPDAEVVESLKEFHQGFPVQPIIRTSRQYAPCGRKPRSSSTSLPGASFSR